MYSTPKHNQSPAMSPSSLLPLLLLLLSHSTGLEISIGIGPPTTPSPSPPAATRQLQPCDFLNIKQYKAYLVIQRFKNTITCDPFGITNTWEGPRPCNYTGFYCEGPPNALDTPTIAAVDFNGKYLAAPTISKFVDQLPDLAFFHMNSNNFAGNLPDLSRLQFLYEVDVSNNKMGGAFPNVAGIKNLLFLDVRYNTFSGCVPPVVFNIKLAVLFFNNNKLGSTLPANLGSTTAKYITLANNGFIGEIPRSIGAAAGTLQEIIFLNNRLSGCIPTEVGRLKKATVFDVGDNLLSGEIPLSFGCLEKVEQLNLANNKLSGDVPDVVCRLENLLNFTLSGNYFTSLGESCWRLIKQRRLNVRNNCIPGLAGQRSPEECYKFACKPKECKQPQRASISVSSELGTKKLSVRSTSSGRPTKSNAYFALINREP